MDRGADAGAEAGAPGTTSTSLPQEMGRLLEAVQALVGANLELVRAQLREEGRQAARRLAVGALAMVPAVIGWGLLCAAAVVGLAHPLGTVGALLLTGALNLLAAMALFVRGVRARRGSGDERKPDRTGGRRTGPPAKRGGDRAAAA